MKQTAVIIFRTVIVLLAGVTLGIMIGSGRFSGHSADIYETGNSKTDELLHLLKNNYVDSVNTDTLETTGIDYILKGLDPHSLYLPVQQAQSVNERLEGGFDGVGIAYILLHDTLAVTQVTPGGPAAKAGLQSGDRIVTLNHKKFAGTHLTLNRVWELFKGEGKAKISLGISRWNHKAVQDYTVQLGRVTLSSLDATYLIAPATGYIKVSKFAATTDVDFKSALKTLQAKGMQRLIVDLRGNGGGYLNAATSLADEFLPKGRLIVYTQGLHERRTDYFATDSGLFQQGKVVVLIDERSASASEILSGALQDWDRATLVGRRSFGKGLVQEQFPFSDGSVINLTIARYYTPTGRSIQKSYVNGTDAYHDDLYIRAHDGELYTLNNPFTDSLQKTVSKYQTSSGKKVYSGVGIIPDIFVPENKALNNPLIKELTSNQLFAAYALDRMLPLMNRYPSADAFARQYQISPNDVTAFIVYASQTLREMDSQELRVAADEIKLLLKAGAIQLKWGDAAYYQFMNGQDADVKKAIEVVNG